MEIKRSEFYFLFFILILGLFLRVYGSNHGLPYAYNSDELVVLETAVRFGTKDFNPHRFDWPSGLMYLSFLLYGFIYCIGRLLGIFNSLDHFKSIYFTDLSLFLLSGRILVAFFGVASIILIYKISKLLSNSFIALLSSLFLAISFLHIRESKILTPDIPMVFFILLSFFFTIKDKNLKYFHFSSFLAGLAAGMKYNAFLSISLPLISIVIQKNTSVINKVIKLLISILSFSTGFLIFCPFALLDSKKFLNDLNWQFTHIRNFGHIGAENTPLKFHLLESLPSAIGLGGTLIIIFAIIYFFIVNDKNKIPIAVYLIIFFIPMVNMKVTFDRYILPLIPIFCYLNSSFISGVLNFFKNKKVKTFIIIFFILTLIIPQLIRSIQYNLTLIKEDTRHYAKIWIESNIQENARIGVELNSPPLNKNRNCIEREYKEKLKIGKNEGERFKFILSHNLIKSPAYDIHYIGPNIWKVDKNQIENMLSLKLDYIILDSISYERFYMKTSQDKHKEIVFERIKFYDFINKKGKLIKVISPNKNIPNGPVIKIYKMKF